MHRSIGQIQTKLKTNMTLSKKTSKVVTTRFRNKSKEKTRELSQYIYELKNNTLNRVALKRSIACKTHQYTDRTRKYDLRVTEKLSIIKADSECLLNMREEFLNSH